LPLCLNTRAYCAPSRNHIFPLFLWHSTFFSPSFRSRPVCQGLFLWRRNPFEIKVISEKPINQESLLFMGGLISKTKDRAPFATLQNLVLASLTLSLFSPAGLWTFISGLLATFWRGEFLWHWQPLASSAADLVYVTLSLGLTVVALANLWLRPASVTTEQRRTLWFCLWSLLTNAAFLGYLSVIYDFHDCFYPSRTPLLHLGAFGARSVASFSTAAALRS
jgi:hypothetical protein